MTEFDLQNIKRGIKLPRRMPVPSFVDNRAYSSRRVSRRSHGIIASYRFDAGVIIEGFVRLAFEGFPNHLRGLPVGNIRAFPGPTRRAGKKNREGEKDQPTK